MSDLIEDAEDYAMALTISITDFDNVDINTLEFKSAMIITKLIKKLEAAENLCEASIDMSLANDGIFDCYGGIIPTKKQVTDNFDKAIKEYQKLKESNNE